MYSACLALHCTTLHLHILACAKGHLSLSQRAPATNEAGCISTNINDDSIALWDPKRREGDRLILVSDHSLQLSSAASLQSTWLGERTD